jgi:hypothetical protein
MHHRQLSQWDLHLDCGLCERGCGQLWQSSVSALQYVSVQFGPRQQPMRMRQWRAPQRCLLSRLRVRRRLSQCQFHLRLSILQHFKRTVAQARQQPLRVLQQTPVGQ